MHPYWIERRPHPFNCFLVVDLTRLTWKSTATAAVQLQLPTPTESTVTLDCDSANECRNMYMVRSMRLCKGCDIFKHRIIVQGCRTWALHRPNQFLGAQAVICTTAKEWHGVFCHGTFLPCRHILHWMVIQEKEG